VRDEEGRKKVIEEAGLILAANIVMSRHKPHRDVIVPFISREKKSESRGQRPEPTTNDDWEINCTWGWDLG
jgi:hypothetical protein